MINAFSSIPREDILEHVNGKIDAVSELIESERQYSNGSVSDSVQVDESLARCVDLIMCEETAWL
jgi:hypothetical protein